MELCDEISLEENEVLPDEKVDDVFFSMMGGKTVTDTIKTSRGDFEVKYPKQKDIIRIAHFAAFMRGGMPSSVFDDSGNYEIQKCATLDVVITSGPAWFENAKKKNKNFSWRDVPDAHFVDEVYAKALQFRQTVQERFAENKEVVPGKTDEADAGGVPADVGDGLFSGVAGSVKRG
ncbi:MAG: hypothetical protein LBH43_19050 [Treponema sp.]|jgi:hypothetical protein|nr:hypothetical protein [Treponema sp.]